MRVTNPQTVHLCDSFMRICEGLSTAPSPGEHAVNICPMNERMNDSFLVCTSCFMKPSFFPFIRAHCGSASLLDSNSAYHLCLSLGHEPNSTPVQFNQLPWSLAIGRKHSLKEWRKHFLAHGASIVLLKQTWHGTETFPRLFESLNT